MRGLLTWLFGALALAVMAGVPAAALEPGVIRPTTTETIAVGGQLQILEDPTGRMTVADVIASSNQFTPSGQEWPKFGISRGAAWTRVALDLSNDPLRTTRRIQFDAIHPDEAALFVVDHAGNVLRSFVGGLDHPRSETYRKFSMSLANLPVDQFTLLARLTTHHVSTLTMTLTSEEQETQEEMIVERALGPTFGAMALAAIYCLLLWVHLRETTCGYGFAFVTTLFIAAHPYINIDRLYWPDALLQPDISRFIYFVGVGLIPVFGLLFSSHFVLAPQRHPRQHRVGMAIAGTIAAAHVLVVTVEPYWFMPVNTFSLFTAAAMIGWLMVTALAERVETARTHALVTVPVVVCLMATNVSGYGLFRQHPILTSSTVIGLMVLATGVTMLLADGFRRRLESKVRERTGALSTVNAALNEAHEAKNRMLGVVAHDLRNPLSAIKAAAQLLLEIPLPQNKRDTLARTIRDGADMSLAMTEDLLDVAAIEQGTFTLVLETCELTSIIHERLDLFRLAAQPKDISIVIQGAVIPPVWADRKRVGQALDNLVSNAVKFSPLRGTVTIALHADAQRARLSVIDNGAGIPAEEIEQIFIPFKRASTQPTAGERSTGLGLAIVKRLIEAQGGTIDVHSTPGAGSRFDLYLPLSRERVLRPAAAAE